MDAYELQETVDRWTMPAASWASRMSTLPPIARAQGPVIYDANGKRYLDFGSGHAAAVLGHNHPRYIEAVRRHLDAVADATFLDTEALRLHRCLGEILTPPLQKSLLVPHGDAAMRAATDIARTVTGGSTVLGVSARQDGALRFFPRTGADGTPRTAGVPALPSPPDGRACHPPWDCDCDIHRGDYPCPRTVLEQALHACGGRPAALVMGPFVGAAVPTTPPGYARALRRLCHQYGMLLIVDESATGFGRTGRMWGHLHEDVVPDIMVVSARFGSGLCIDAVCAAPDIADHAAASDGFDTLDPWHDPVACAAASAGIDIMQRENLTARAAAIGERLRLRLEAMAADIPLIRTVRGRGALYAVELADDRDPPKPGHNAARAAVLACRDRGLLLRQPDRDDPAPLVHVSPPMVTTEAEVDEGMDILGHVLRDMTAAARVTATLPRPTRYA